MPFTSSHTGSEEYMEYIFRPLNASIQRETLPKISPCIDNRRFIYSPKMIAMANNQKGSIDQYIKWSSISVRKGRLIPLPAQT